MRPLLLVILLFGVIQSNAQDVISGRWVGNYGKGILSMDPEKVVIDISTYNDSIITGSSHLYYRSNQYEHYTIKGVYHKADSSAYFYEDSTLGVNLGSSTNCLGNYHMKLKRIDTIYRLEGRWQDNGDGIFGCPSVSVWLEKPIQKPVSESAKKKDKNLERPSNIQSLIEVSAAEKDSIKIEVLDNARIDNDVVSVYINDDKVIDKQLISKEPIVFYVSVSKQQPLCKIKMAAESMGSVAPCTALLRVIMGERKYEINLSSSFINNGVLELFLKE